MAPKSVYTRVRVYVCVYVLLYALMCVTYCIVSARVAAPRAWAPNGASLLKYSSVTRFVGRANKKDCLAVGPSLIFIVRTELQLLPCTLSGI